MNDTPTAPAQARAEVTAPDGSVWSGDPEAVEAMKEMFAREAKRDPQSIKSRFFIRGEISRRDAIKELARTFPSLAELEMFQPDAHFDGDEMDAFRSGVLCHGGKCAFQFIASVWNPTAKRKCGKFDLHDAMSVWDDEHRAAFVAWATDPWWP
jgi:hypothetical protein